ncbi:MAG: response regulator [Proteobacteria bacterium]|nr:response regulator [Pseudomonadota bacterium]MCP4916900.1 response regulator [Pseudomonadota bacterium]
MDNDAFAARAAASHLREHYEVQVARSATEALDLLDEESFDVLLCETDLPGTSGVELYERLERTNPRAADRMIFMSEHEVACPRELVDKAPATLRSAIRSQTEA